jgi:hypothetical protein
MAFEGGEGGEGLGRPEVRSDVASEERSKAKEFEFVAIRGGWW